jgi:hypothetical protein
MRERESLEGIKTHRFFSILKGPTIRNSRVRILESQPPPPLPWGKPKLALLQTKTKLSPPRLLRKSRNQKSKNQLGFRSQTSTFIAQDLDLFLPKPPRPYSPHRWISELLVPQEARWLRSIIIIHQASPILLSQTTQLAFQQTQTHQRVPAAQRDPQYPLPKP